MTGGSSLGPVSSPFFHSFGAAEKEGSFYASRIQFGDGVVELIFVTIIKCQCDSGRVIIPWDGENSE